MPLSPGSCLGHYEIQSLRGAGGMGEVYRSRDVRLDRTVAVKVLPAHVASDPDFRRRFEREARSVAALSHPHICALYDVGEAPNPENQTGVPVQFLVMEYLEGQTLAEVLERGPMSIDGVLRVGIEIADAIDQAHRQGVVHRDLKPGNIMMTANGTKLLDFGLAKAAQPPFSGMAAAATVSAPLTGRGTILGTPNYMAPEQVEGKDTDHRSDIFSFGAIVYEMTTGKKAFEGSSAPSVMAAILERDPPSMMSLQPLASPLLDHVVTRCLAKVPAERWQSAGDVMRELTWIARSSIQTISPASRSSRKGLRGWLILATIWALIATVAALAMMARRQRPPIGGPPQVLDITTPPTGDPLSLSISPDGQKAVFVATSDGRSQLWLRYLNNASAQPLAGTDDPQFPFWAPDSRSIGFATSGLLKRIDLDGGGVRELANAPLFLGGTWNTDHTILFVPNTNSRVLRVPENGGEATPVTPPLDRSTNHHFPSVLPDGRHFLYYVAGAPETRGVYMAAVDGTMPRRLLDAEAAAIYAPQGQLLFLRHGTLYSQHFDPGAGTVDGPVSPLIEHIAAGDFAGARIVAVSVSRDGTVAYRTNYTLSSFRFDIKWVDRSGNVLERIQNGPEVLMNPSLSPDGRRMLFFRRNIWLFDLPTRIANPFTLDPAVDFPPSGLQMESPWRSARTGRVSSICT